MALRYLNHNDKNTTRQLSKILDIQTASGIVVSDTQAMSVFHTSCIHKALQFWVHECYVSFGIVHAQRTFCHPHCIVLVFWVAHSTRSFRHQRFLRWCVQRKPLWASARRLWLWLLLWGLRHRSHMSSK